MGEGQVLGVIEAMKMELSLKAPFAGIVTSVGAGAGEQVKLGAPLSSSWWRRQRRLRSERHTPRTASATGPYDVGLPRGLAGPTSYGPRGPDSQVV